MGGRARRSVAPPGDTSSAPCGSRCRGCWRVPGYLVQNQAEFLPKKVGFHFKTARDHSGLATLARAPQPRFGDHIAHHSPRGSWGWAETSLTAVATGLTDGRGTWSRLTESWPLQGHSSLLYNMVTHSNSYQVGDTQP